MKSALVFFMLLAIAVSCVHVRGQSVADELTVDEIHRRILSGQNSCFDITEYYVKRIATYDKRSRSMLAKEMEAQGKKPFYPCCLDGPVPNSVISMAPDWQTQALALDQHFNTTAQLVGPMHCVPLMIKDNVNTHNMPTSSGTVAMRYQIGAPDAPALAGMRAAGAIALAKVNMAELALSGANSFSSLGGETVNVYNFNSTAYGSSGGTGASISANFGVIGLGTDTCGSIVGPAAAGNLFGLRGTVDLVSVDGVAPAGPGRDVLGPITRTVTDNAKGLDALVFGADVDSYEYARKLSADAGRSVRIGLWLDAMEHSFPNDLPTGAVQRQKTIAAAQQLARAGVRVVEVTTGMQEVVAIVKSLMPYNSKCAHSRERRLLTEYLRGFGPSAAIQSIDQLLSVEHGVIASSRAALLGVNAAPPVTDPEVVEACAQSALAKKRMIDTIDKLLDEYGVDVLLYPVDTAQHGLAQRVYRDASDSFCFLSAFSGLPSISIPIGFIASNDEPGVELPTGMLVLARRNMEQQLLNVAFLWEQIAQPRAPSPLIPLIPLR